MIRKILGRLVAVRSLAVAFFALASFAASAFDTPYLTFRSAETFTLSATKAWDGTLQKASSNPADDSSWSDWTGVSITAVESNGQYYIYLRGTGNTYVNNSFTAWTLTGSNIYCEGDIETLRGYDGDVPAMAESCYKCLFAGCTALKSIPTLSATTVPTLSYYHMFQNCTSLEINTSGAGVEWSLPAGTTGAGIWNYDMFSGTAGTFTDNPVPGMTYYVASALPYGQLYQKDGSGTLTPVFSGASVSIDLTPTIKNGATPYAFTLSSGTLPPGLSIEGSTLSGTPTTPGSYDFTMSVEDAEHHTLAAAAYHLLIMRRVVTAISFIGPDGVAVTTNCVELNEGITTWDEEWYVVSGTLDYGIGGVTVSGNANLVLADESLLSVTGAINKAGVNVAPGNSLSIYAQSGGSGTLNASGNKDNGYSAGGAGIGGNDHEGCGTVTINGGVINASGGNYSSAGIGGGYYGAGGAVTINGGTIIAIGGTWYGAGIGGGYYGAGGNVTIKGGTITATAGSSGGCGIGKGYYGSSSGTLTVGAAVCVKAGYSANPTTELEHGDGGVITVGSQRYFYVETLGMTLVEGSLDAYTNENKIWDLNETIVGGSTPYSFSGTVPDGLSLTSAGMLSGAVATAGSYPFTVVVTDDAEDTKNFIYTLTVMDPTPLSAQTNLGTVKIGKPKDFNLSDTVSGGVPPYTFAFYGDHASEFSLSGGTLSFLAAAAGNYSCAINVTDKLGTTLTPAPVYTVEAVAATGYTDDDPEEPASGVVVNCRTPEGVFQRTCHQIENSSTVVTWEDSWYYVTGNVSLSAGAIVSGKVSLILGDGAALTIVGATEKAGISVLPDNTLTIYCQGVGSGVLTATGGSGSAGIGGDHYKACGKVTIYGGVVTATGTGWSAGIGGGDDGNAPGGDIAVYGGTVTAEGGKSSTPGIGGGYSAPNDGTLTVGDNVVVKAGTSSDLTDANILTPVDGKITMSHSSRQYYKIETIGPAPLSQTQNSFAVYKDEAVNLSFADTVSGGTKPYTFAYKSGSLPAGISSATFSGTPTEAGTFVFVVAVTDSGVDAEAQNEDFTYTLTVTAKPKTITYYNGADEITGLTPSNFVEGVGATLPTTAPAASGYELEGWYTTSECNPDDKVTTISAEATGDQVFYANWKATVYNVVYMKDSTTQFDDPAPTTYTVESETLVLPTTAVNAGKGFYGWYTNSGCLGAPTTSIPHGSTGDKTFWAKWGAMKSMETYVDAGGNAMPAVECAQVASDTTTLETGWYVVKGEVSIPGTVTVVGNVNLILADGAYLAVTSANNNAGINVSSANSLTVHSQTAVGTGKLDAVGGSLSAGIGGNSGEDAGSVTINGGTVMATCGNNAAGIGGGHNGSGGVVAINGGTVTVIGGQFAAGIGGGYMGDGGTVAIGGGCVVAYSSGYGAGIGKGWYGSSEGSLVVGNNISVKSGDDSVSTSEIVPDANGVVTLDGNRYYVVETVGPMPLAQAASAFAAYVGEAFELNLDDTICGGSGSYLFTLKDSTLPAWLTRTGNVLSGTPTAEGVSSFTYTVADSVETTLDAEDFTYTVSVEIRPQPITYMDGSEVMTGLTPSNYIEGVGVELPLTASKTGYLFLGWYTAATGGERVYSVSVEATGHQTFYAHWTTESYTIIYKDGNTTLTGLAPTNYDIETATFNLPEPLAPEGKAFVGWFTDADFNTQATSIPAGSTGNKTFYVKWRDAEAGEGENVVTFIDANGSERTENCNVLIAAMTTLETGWYVVNNDLTVNSSVMIDGNVNIVLVDGKTLTVNANNAWATAGITVAAGSSLSIYGQAEGTGSLNATGGDYGAGIGSGYNKNAGNVTINGGTVTATGHDGAGIGGATSGVCGTVTVNRGTVVATGGGMCPGIGSGSSASAGGTVIINGGDVTATGGSGGAAGIGGGNNCPGGVVTITGGAVVATGTDGAGIGGSGSGAGAAVTITGGSVSAIAGAAYRYGIGGGNTATDQGSLTVGDGMVVRAGEGENPADELDVDSNGAVTLVAHRYYVVDDGSAPIGPTLYEIQYYDGQYNQIQVEPSKYEAGTVTVLGTPAEKPGYVFVGWYTLPNFNSEKVTQIGANETGVKMFYAKWEKASERAVVNYLDVDGVEKSVECTIISGEKDLLTNGWYAVTNSVTLTHGLGVTNDVRLVIADNVTLTVSNGTFGKAGIHVPSDSFLTIFGQSGDSGVLSVTGGSYAAGIGGDRDEASSGAVTVNGGVVIAQGGSKGAGIGGGGSGSGGAVTINGGTVTASGGNDAAGIGGGYTGSCGAVTINGGTVTANGGASSYDSGAGIGGGGYGGSGGDVVINGGTVTATSGGRYSEGIGSGNGEGTRGTLKAGAGVNVWAGANADSAEELTQKKDDGTFWIFGTYNYYHAETATAESEFNIYYYDSDGETPLDLSPAKYQSGTGLAELPTPAARMGYTFAGWWTSQWAHLAEPVTEIAPGSTGNVTIYAKWTPNTYTITYVTDPMVIEDLGPVSYTYGVGVAELPEPESFNPYLVFDGWYENSVKVTSISATAVGDKTLTARWIEDATKITSVTFAGAEGAQTESCRILTTDVTALETGWYVVNSDLDYGAQGLTVSGDVKLVLADGASLTATAASYSQKAGINVPEGASLTIYAQSEGTGELTVAGDPENLGYAAGIGGNANESCGTVTIYGGIVTATGGDMAAGIGGGYYGDGGTVTINGGVVTATGGPGESGIGKGAGAENQVVLTVGGGISVFVGDNANPSIDMLEVDECGVVTMPSRPKQYYIVRADSGEPAFEIVDGVLVGANLKGNADIVIPDSVLEIGQRVFEDETVLASVVIPNSVTNIGYSVFDGCTSLTNVTFGTGLKAIGRYAFSHCTALEELAIPGNVEHVCEGAFYGCSGLVSLTIEEGVKTIDTYAFYGCSVLTGDSAEGLYFPDGLEEIGDSAFISCPQLEKVSLPGSMYVLGAPMSQAFGSDTEVVYRTTDPVFYILGDTLYSVDTKGNASVTIPGTVKKIGTASFRNIPTLERVTVPASVTNIASLAFYACSNLVEVAIGDSVESIDSDAFAECTSLTDVTIPDSVAVIGRRAFKDCMALESATVLAGDIGDDAFNGCTNLATVVFGDGVTGIGDSAFRGCIPLTSLAVPGNVAAIGSSAFWGCSNLVEVVISNGVSKTIGDWAFSSCESLATLSLGDGVASIGDNAFMNCRALAALAMPDSVETIGASAFSGCSGLAALTFGSGLKTVGSEAFDGCSSLENGVDGLYFPDGLESIGADAFRMCNKLTKVSLPSSQYANGTIHPAFDYWQVSVDYRGVAPVFYVDADGFMRSVNLKGATEITIPSTVHDMQIGAFAESDTLTSVVIPSSVTNIAMGAFRACPNLGHVTISEGVKTIGENAFMGCASLAELTIPNGVTVIGDMAFCRCTALESITVPKGVDIGMFAFYGCSSMTSVNIAGEATRMRLSSRMLLRATSSNPDATSVGGFAFYECSNLTSATIGSAVDEIGGGAFGACPKLTTVTLQNNDNFTTDNGMLLTKDGATLVSVYGSNTSVTVPEGVAAIKEGACAGDGKLQSVVLPSGVTTIGEAAFSNATAFASITIPASVTTIGANAFCDTALATVYVAKGDTARVQALVEGTGYAGTVAYVESGSEPATDWPADTSTVEGQTAAEAFGITGDLATADAKKLADWAKENSVEFEGAIITDAYLLNCANTASAVEAATETAEEAIKITAITFDSEGNPVLTCLATYGNGKVVVEGAESLTSPIQWHDKASGDKFFRTVLKP